VTQRAAAFLDRDGTLNQLVADPESGLPESPLHVRDVRLIAGAAVAVRALTNAGFVVVCVTNQPAAAKGKATVEQLMAVHERVLELLRAEGAACAASRICMHHPESVIPELAGPCDCRKPAPGMLLDAAAELDLDLTSSWMLGDSDADVGAGHAAGARSVLIENPQSSHRRRDAAAAEFVAVDLAQAVSHVVAGGRA
jgi:D-glycero-D-manno-heptose 1,7-bisphosphate phosphatase